MVVTIFHLAAFNLERRHSKLAKYALVDKETCIACGVCGEIAPESITFDDEGLAEIIQGNNTGTVAVHEDLYEKIVEASEDCPTGSVKVADNPFYPK